VCFERGLEGAVEYAGLRIPVQVERDEQRVHALATDQVASLAFVHSCVATLESPGADASAAVRALAKEQLAPLLGANADQLEIARRGRIPVLRVAGHDAPFDLSLSHHGRFVAFAAESLCERSPR
jgi:hypothetical protein